ncbi:MAG: BLUF domain-containing protein [Myxococcaceae bacterium]|nr:MAG: BLUF domain-containing protein [Myxococcaceae bacterium]
MNLERSGAGERLWVLVYGSASVGTIDEETLRSILRTSREHNARLGVTGALFYRNGNFLQVLEGEETVVRALFARIRTDPRHTGCFSLLEGEFEERLFPAGTMGLLTDTDRSIEHSGALDGLARNACTGPASKGARTVRKLLEVFERIVR